MAEELRDLHLADLHERAAAAGVPAYRKLSRDELVAELERRVGGDGTPAGDGGAEAGATWWLETQWDAVGQAGPALATFDRLREGPPS